MGSLTRAELDTMVAEATVDAYGDYEQLSGFYTMIEDHLAVPFKTRVLGVEVMVRRVDLRDDIVAICHRGSERQAIRILDLPLPDPAPEGAASATAGPHTAAWIAAYRHWARG